MSTRQTVSLTVLHNLATKGRVGSKSRSCCELNIPTLLSLRVLSFLFNHSPSKILFRFIWLRQFKENRNENSQPPSKPRTPRRRLCRSASRSLKRRRRVNPPEASSLRRDGTVAMTMTTTTTTMMVAVAVVPLAQGHRSNVCGVSFHRRDRKLGSGDRRWLTRGGDTGSLLSSLLSFMQQAEAPQQIAMRPRKNGGTDRAPSPFARSGSIRRARTCSCASYPLHAWYAPRQLLPTLGSAPPPFVLPHVLLTKSGRYARLRST